MNSLIFPSYVQKGDRVIILSPSSKIDKSFLKGAKKRLKSWGLEVVMAKHAGSSHGTYGVSIKQRVEDLQNALDDEKAKVILCSRGGYGAVHLLGKLDFTRFREHPKWLIGFSDITALHNVLQKEEPPAAFYEVATCPYFMGCAALLTIFPLKEPFSL